MPDNRAVLITGGAGYIGSQAAKTFAAAGWTPVVLDNLSRGHRDAVRWGPLVVGDIRDTALVEHTLRHYGCTAAVHFAAFAYVGESVQRPDLYYANNVGGTLSLLAAMRAAGVDRLIFSSTCATYGIPHSVPITEATPQVPINPYGASKLMVERILADHGTAFGLRHVSLRYFNAAGADPEAETGERHDPEPHVIPLALRAASGGAAFTILGTDYPTPDGTCIRDYVHVSDLADAHVLALDYLERGGASDAFNLGSGNGISVRQILGAVERVSGRPVPAIDAPRRPGDPPVLVADAGKARSVLRWTPRRPDIATIVADAWAWHCRD